MNFGVRVAFDFGNCTGPSCIYDWKMLSSTQLKNTQKVPCRLTLVGNWRQPEFSSTRGGKRSRLLTKALVVVKVTGP